MSRDKQQIEKVRSGVSTRDVRGPKFQPLRRALKVPVWGDLSIRLGLALGLIFLVIMNAVAILLRRRFERRW